MNKLNMRKFVCHYQNGRKWYILCVLMILINAVIQPLEQCFLSDWYYSTTVKFSCLVGWWKVQCISPIERKDEVVYLSRQYSCWWLIYTTIKTQLFIQKERELANLFNNALQWTWSRKIAYVKKSRNNYLIFVTSDMVGAQLFKITDSHPMVSSQEICAHLIFFLTRHKLKFDKEIFETHFLENINYS